MVGARLNPISSTQCKGSFLLRFRAVVFLIIPVAFLELKRVVMRHTHTSPHQDPPRPSCELDCLFYRHIHSVD